MTFENIPIKPCCKYMDNVLMLNDIRESITFDEKEPVGSEWRFMILWKDNDCMPLLYCPSCGKKIEEEEAEE